MNEILICVRRKNQLRPNVLAILVFTPNEKKKVLYRYYSLDVFEFSTNDTEFFSEYFYIKT